GLAGQPHVGQQHGRAEDGGCRIDDALADYVGRGSVHRLEVGHPVAVATARHHAKAPDGGGAFVGEDVAVEVGQQHHVEAVRVGHQPAGEVVGQEVVEGDVGVV